jgi:hypothetical protein
VQGGASSAAFDDDVSAPDSIVGSDGYPSIVSASLAPARAASMTIEFAHAWMDVSVYDPIGIRLTQLQNWLHWQDVDGCAKHGLGIHQWDKHTSTGWVNLGHNHAWAGYNCYKLGDWAQNAFMDPIFCVGVDTFIVLQNEIDGLSNAGAGFYPTISWSGGCTFLLSGYVDYDNWST